MKCNALFENRCACPVGAAGEGVERQLLSSHEGLGSAVWGGQAQLASVNTAVQINHDLQQTIAGGTRLAHGLSQAASMIEQHEADSAHSLTSFAANA